MTTWRYCLVRDKADGEVFYSVREVYFEGDQPASWTAEGVDPFGNTLDEIFAALIAMTSTAGREVLDLTGPKPQLIRPATARKLDRKSRPQDAGGES